MTALKPQPTPAQKISWAIACTTLTLDHSAVQIPKFVNTASPLPKCSYVHCPHVSAQSRAIADMFVHSATPRHWPHVFACSHATSYMFIYSVIPPPTCLCIKPGHCTVVHACSSVTAHMFVHSDAPLPVCLCIQPCRVTAHIIVHSAAPPTAAIEKWISIREFMREREREVIWKMRKFTALMDIQATWALDNMRKSGCACWAMQYWICPLEIEYA